MSPRSLPAYFRKSVKWGCVVVTLLLVLVWLWSGWWWFQWTGSNGLSIGVEWGQVRIATFDLSAFSMTPGSDQLIFSLQETDPGWFVLAHRAPFNWAFGWEGPSSPLAVRVVWIPLWSLVVLAGGIGGWAWRLDTLARRRERSHLCAKCGYDRSGLAAGAVCPECGAPKS